MARPLVTRKQPTGARPAAARNFEEVAVLASDLQAVAHPVRLQILEILARSTSPVCVSDLQEQLPVQQPTVSHHLRLLRQAGLVGSEKRGLRVYCFLNRDAVAALRHRVLLGLDNLGR